MRAPLNLASRPAGNERLPRLLFWLAVLALGLATVRHAFFVAGLASTAATRLDREVESMQDELKELRRREQALGVVRPPAGAVERWAYLKTLVDQRTFSWTGLLGRLEAALPGAIRLTAIRPETGRGRIRLGLEAMARSAEDALELVKVLEQRPEFAEVLVLSIGEAREGIPARYEMTYLPGAGEAANASASEPEPPGEAGP